MRKLQKLLWTIFVLAAVVLCFGKTNAQASTFANAKIATISDASEIEKIDAMYTQQCAFNDWNTKEVKEDYFSFTLKKDSWVYLSANYSQFDYDGGQTHITIYTNSSMSNKKAEFGCGYWEYTKELNDFWSAGTYYVYVRTSLANYSSFNANVNIIGAAIPTDKIFTYSTKVSKKMDSAKVTMKCALGDFVKYVQFRPDTTGSEDLNNTSYWKQRLAGSWYSGDDIVQVLDKQDGGYTGTATKNGKVTFMIILDSSYTERYAGTFKVTGIDSKKPTVSGVKNGKTYTKAVTIEFSDADSGVKSAKLNGKSIKSGKTVSASGSYKLVVTDKAGNKKTVKFKIK
jgi:hypothetical protein